MTTATLTPRNTKAGRVVNLAGRKLWRKQVLPLGSINYEGRQIRFDANYHKELVRNFRAGAYPQVPFQLADATNTHTNDPERTRGELVDLRAEPDGLYGYFELTDPALVMSNPKLGVSCRILEDYTREHDQKRFGRALQHVLGTLDPKITGMKPWESVELASTPVEHTVDLASADWSPTRQDGEVVPNSQTEEKHVVELSTAQLDRLNALLAEDQDDEETEDEPNGLAAEFLDPSWFEAQDGDGEGDDFADLDAEDEEDDDQTDDVTLATVSNLQGQVLELTNRLASREQAVELAQLQATGLAPSIIQAALPLLTVGRQAGVLQLSNGDQTTVADQARALLRTVLELGNRGLDVVNLDRETGFAPEGDGGVSAARTAQLDYMDTVYGR